MHRCRSSILLSLIISILALGVKGDQPSYPRTGHGCVLLKTTIYCYGGTYGEGGDPVYYEDDRSYALDLSQEKSVKELNTSWTKFSGGREDIGITWYFAMVAIPEQNSFVIDGGQRLNILAGTTPSNEPITEYTDIYNTTGGNGVWLSLPVGDHQQVYHHTAVYSPTTKRVYLGGGQGRLLVNGKEGAMFFPSKMSIVDLNGQWTTSSNQLMTINSDTRLHHAAALGPDGNTIYYIGGIYPNETATSATGEATFNFSMVDMASILTYNINDAQWKSVYINTNGDRSSIPVGRMDHTVTLHPTTKELIVYGGVDMGAYQGPLRDYVYTLDTTTMTWKNQTPNMPDITTGAGPRFGHAAVLAGNHSLFIIFGSVAFDRPTVDINVLNINDWTWMDTVPAIVVNENDDDDDDTKGVSTGTIVGAVIGSIVGVAILVGVIVFFLIRRRKRNYYTEKPMAVDDDDVYNNSNDGMTAAGISDGTTTVYDPVGKRSTHGQNLTSGKNTHFFC
ncbi:hypothetical protein BDA99DRAFT_121249 [Phascolomyces articulosus]|uniref:Galactose oxidase n=1 Tax=Phascolomyces articulosus TaxID=60185 RepID=A0AAD5KB59_9FUNG|nr:hypothetical protein BDA99DRAFT_121249 [Phascolomyces articulosus]